MKYIYYNNKKCFYEYRVAKEGDKCLATKEPKDYCNGFFAYSSKDEGNGMAFVVMKIE